MILSLTQGSNVPRSTDTTITPGELSSQDIASKTSFIVTVISTGWMGQLLADFPGVEF